MRQKSTPKERMEEVLVALGLSANTFEKECGLGRGFVRRITHVINRKTREKIKAVFPTINLEYVARGVGEMFELPDAPKETIKERIGQFSKQIGITEKEFCRRASLSTSFITNMSDNIRKSSLDRIIKTFPKLNPSWLAYGEGDMLQEATEIQETDSTKDRIRQLIKFLGLSNVDFEHETGMPLGYTKTMHNNITKKNVDRITSRYPFVNPLWLLHGQGEMISDRSRPVVMGKFGFAPLVPQVAYAGYLCGFADEEYIESLEKIPYILNEDSKGAVIAFEVSGDSMDDGSSMAYRNGDIVLCRELQLTDYRQMHLPIKTYDFVIVHNEGILVKSIKEHNIEKGTITIHSLNKFYGDVEMSLADIRKIFVVIQRISEQKR